MSTWWVTIPAFVYMGLHGVPPVWFASGGISLGRQGCPGRRSCSSGRALEPCADSVRLWSVGLPLVHLNRVLALVPGDDQRASIQAIIDSLKN